MKNAETTLAETKPQVNSFNATKHGQSRKGHWTTEYLAWTEMKKRCLNPNYKNFSRYGGRGIKICKRWRNNFLAFYADMGDKPSPELQLDRKRNNGNYTPSNCWWATRRQQCNNRGSNRFITFNGCRKTLQQWADEAGFNSNAISRRIGRGWSIKDALTKQMRETKSTKRNER